MPPTHSYWGTFILYIYPSKVIFIYVNFCYGNLSKAFIFYTLSSNTLKVLVAYGSIYE